MADERWYNMAALSYRIGRAVSGVGESPDAGKNHRGRVTLRKGEKTVWQNLV